MNIYKLKVYIIILIILTLNSNIASAAVVYETKALEGNKIRIIIRANNESQNNIGIALTHYYLKNGKTLHIGYEQKDEAPSTVYLDYDLNNAIPPIRVILENIDASDWIPFKDIKGIEAEEYIRHLHDAGIIKGRPSGAYDPEMYITRAEFMAIMGKALKIEGTGSNSEEFTDIEGHWANNILLLAAEKGLISGFGDKTLKPDRFITVGEVSSIVSRAFQFSTSNNGIYSKLRKLKWYSMSVKKMFDTGILTVNDSIYTNFDEENYLNRANCAMMVSRALSTY